MRPNITLWIQTKHKISIVRLTKTLILKRVGVSTRRVCYKRLLSQDRLYSHIIPNIYLVDKSVLANKSAVWQWTKERRRKKLLHKYTNQLQATIDCNKHLHSLVCLGVALLQRPCSMSGVFCPVLRGNWSNIHNLYSNRSKTH